MRKRVIWIGSALLIAVGVILATRGVGQARVALDQQVAAEFLGVDPDRLVPDREEAMVSPSPWGDRKLSWWVYSGRTLIGEAVRADVFVDPDLYYVASLGWRDDKAHWGPEASPDTPLLTREEALKAGQEFVSKRCWFYRQEDRLEYEQYRPQLPQPLWAFGWRGPGPEELQHYVKVGVSAVTGEVVTYSASIDPPEVPAAKPVRLSAEEAVQRVREMLPTLQPALVEVTKLAVMGRLLTGGTPRSLPGQPVYQVCLEGYKMPDNSAPPDNGGVPLDRRRLAFFAIAYMVDATTGEVLTKRVSLQEAPPPGAPRISAEQVPGIVTTALPTGLQNPQVVVERGDCPRPAGRRGGGHRYRPPLRLGGPDGAPTGPDRDSPGRFQRRGDPRAGWRPHPLRTADAPGPGCRSCRGLCAAALAPALLPGRRHVRHPLQPLGDPVLPPD